MKRTIGSLLLAPLLLGGCATMNKSECLNADWRMVGIEDGSKGRTIDYLGNHRSACAKHNVTPDLAAYEGGHYEGLLHYCTEHRGFELGKSGGSYNGVCPAKVEQGFLDGYYVGKEYHDLKEAVSSVQGEISDSRHALKRIKAEIGDKEKLVISDATGSEQRAALLKEIKQLERKRGRLQAQLVDLTREEALREEAFRRFSSQLSY